MTTLNGTPTEVEGTVWGCKPPTQPFWMSIMVADVKVLIVINGSRVFAEKNYSAPFFDRQRGEAAVRLQRSSDTFGTIRAAFCEASRSQRGIEIQFTATTDFGK